MALSIRTQKVTTNNTNPSFALAVGSAEIANGDLIVLIMQDTATGTTASFATSSDQQLEGLALGADWSATVSDCDEVANDSTNSRFVRVWSARADVTSTTTFTISGTYAGSTGIRRAQCYVINPDGGTVPVRASRKAGTVTVTNTTNGANVVDAFSLSAVTALRAALVGGFYTANTMASNPTLDANGDGSTYEATAVQNGNGAGAFCQVYETGGVRPAIPANVKWVSNPGTGGKSFVFVEYKLESPPVTGTSVLSGGGTLAATGKTTKFGTGVLSGGGTLASAGTRKVIGTSVLAGGGTFTAAQGGHNNISGVAALSGGGTFTSAGARRITGTGTFSAGGTISAVGTRKVLGTSVFVGAGTFTAQQRVNLITYSAGGTWSSGSVILAAQSQTGTATFTGGGTFSATGAVAGTKAGIAAFRPTVTLAAVGTKKVYGTASFSGVGTFRATQGSVVLAAQNDLASFDRSSRVTLNSSSRISLKG